MIKTVIIWSYWISRNLFKGCVVVALSYVNGRQPSVGGLCYRSISPGRKPSVLKTEAWRWWSYFVDCWNLLSREAAGCCQWAAARCIQFCWQGLEWRQAAKWGSEHVENRMCLMSGSVRWECSLHDSQPRGHLRAPGVDSRSVSELTTSLGGGKSFSNIQEWKEELICAVL